MFKDELDEFFAETKATPKQLAKASNVSPFVIWHLLSGRRKDPMGQNLDKLRQGMFLIRQSLKTPDWTKITQEGGDPGPDISKLTFMFKG